MSIATKKGAECTVCPVRHKGFCGRLSDRVRQRVAGIARAKDYPVGHSFWTHENPLDFRGIVRNGYLRLQRYSMDGRRQIVSLVPSGEVVGEVEETHGDYELEAATGLGLCRLDRRELHRLMDEEGELRQVVRGQYVERLEAIRQLTWALCLLTPRERFCAFLIRATRVMPYHLLPDGKGVLTLELPRADIADFLGTSKESISRVSHQLASEGFIEILNPQHFLIPDLDALARQGAVTTSATRTHRALRSRGSGDPELTPCLTIGQTGHGGQVGAPMGS